jgi:hypothetical protein
MEKISFALDVEDGWPPVAVEHVWCEKDGSVYELKNAPFFIHGLAFGDRFSATSDSVNGCIFEFTTEESSGHSLVWLIEQAGLKLAPYESELLHLGCSIEGFPSLQLYAIDVPPQVEHSTVNAIMDKLAGLGFALAFPVWRHE